MAKEFTFKGKTMKELNSLSIEEFGKLITSRQRRTLRNPLDKALIKRVEKALNEKQAGKEPKAIRTHKRNTVILPKFVGLKFAVYNGHEFAQFDIQQDMLGHVLGEFSQTRKRIIHGKAGIGATKSSTAINARG